MSNPMETTQCQPTAAELKLSRPQQRALVTALMAGELKWFVRTLLRRPRRSLRSSQLPQEQQQKLQQDYHEDLAQLEQQRLQIIDNCWPIRKVALPFLVVITIASLLFLLDAFAVLIFVLPLCWASLLSRMLQEGILPDYARFNQQFLTRLLPAIGSRYGSFYYQPGQTIAPNRFQNRIHFGTRQLYQSIKHAEQAYYFHGNYRGCDWELQQVKLLGSRSGKKGPTVLFEGYMMVLNLPRSFNGITTLNLACPLASAAQVHLEKSQFSSLFRVESTDQIAARAWLTPAVMERFTAINQLCIGSLHAHLDGSSLILLLPGLQFASPLALDTPITSCLAGQPFIKELEQLFALMDALLAQFSTAAATQKELN